MYLLVNVLEQPEHLVAILEGFAKIGIKEKEILKKAIGIVKSLCGDLCAPGKGILFAVPLSFVDGLPEDP